MAVTSNFKLKLIDFDKIPWNDDFYDNMHIIDAIMARYIAISDVQGSWENATAVTVGQRYVDNDSDTVWEVLVAHTTPSTGTFAASRSANTTYWQSITVDATYRGAWAAVTDYLINDFVSDSSRYGVVQTIHTSVTSYDTGVSNGDIVTLIDVSADVAATAADVVSTNADVVSTTADVASTTADASSASTSASNASSSASTASTQASNASTSASNASTSETNAAASAATAAGETSAAMPKYTFSTSTAASDPGAGVLRYNHATVASVTEIYIDNTTADTGNPDVAAWLLSWDSSTSTIHSQIRLVEPGTPANYAVFNITNAVDSSGYVTLTVAHVDSNGTFSNTDSIRISNTRTGDKGDTGNTGPPGSGLSDVVDDTTPQLGGDLDCNGAQVQWSKGADVASAPALPVLTDGNYFDVTGTTGITSINTTGGPGTLIKLHFDGVLTLTHHATDLYLAGEANFTTAAGDELEFIEYATGDYRMTGWSLAGTAPGGGGGGAFLGEGAAGASVGDSGDIIRVNQNQLDTNQTFASGDNGSATGPLSITSGVTLTVTSGCTFAVI